MDKLLDQTKNQANTMQTEMDSLLNQTRNQATTMQAEMDSLLTQIKDEAKKMQTETEKISEDLNNKINEVKGTYLPKCRNAGKPFQYWLFNKNLHESTEVKLLSPPQLLRCMKRLE